ncbi:MAG: hypothetical protein ACJAZX_001606 [Rickettsiales bacterium]|jgi:uncharacterized protein YbjQ (UPF0145 family)
MEILFYLIIVITAFSSGSLIEKAHYKSIRKREEEFINQPILNVDCDFSDLNKDCESNLVSGSVVLAADKFKVLMGALRGIFGGSISAFESLTDRGRREAILRLRKQAIGCDSIMNLRLTTSEIGKNKIEIFAYATAIYYKK